jgi:hypothetical protein
VGAFTLRQSTPGNNFKALIKDELVKRFETVVLEEIQRYESSICDNKKNFSLISDQLDIICNQQKGMLELINGIRIACNQDFISEKDDLFKRFEDHRKNVNEKVRNIESLTNSIFKACGNHITKNDLLDEVSRLQSQMINIGLNAEKEKKKLCEFIHEVKEELKDLVYDLQDSMNKRLMEFDNKFAELSKIVESNKIDSTGLLKELQVYKKSVFIIEKNIENIYTKIERLKQV